MPSLRWSAEKGAIWKAKLPPWSKASTVLSGAGVGAVLFVCSEPHQLPAVEAASGRLLWQRSLGDIAASAGVDMHEANGYTPVTPVFDGRRVFTVFGSGVVVAHDADGTRLWAGVVREPEKGPEHGPSPLRSGDAFRASDGSSLAAGLGSLEQASVTLAGERLYVSASNGTTVGPNGSWLATDWRGSQHPCVRRGPHVGSGRGILLLHRRGMRVSA